MIEFNGYIFDFDNWECLGPNGQVKALMRLDRMFYISWIGWRYTGHSLGSWNYIFHTPEENMELYQRYEQYFIEEILLK